MCLDTKLAQERWHCVVFNVQGADRCHEMSTVDRADELRQPMLVDVNLDGLIRCAMDEWANNRPSRAPSGLSSE